MECIPKRIEFCPYSQSVPPRVVDRLVKYTALPKNFFLLLGMATQRGEPVKRFQVRVGLAVRMAAAAAVAGAVSVTALALPAGADWHHADVTIGLGSGVRVSLTPTQPGNCSRDETNVSFTTNGTADKQTLWFVSKADGSCALERSYNTWNVNLPSGGTGQIWHGQRNLYGFYTLECDGTWTNYRCLVPQFPGYNPYTVDALVIAPPTCTGKLAVGASCSQMQTGVDGDLAFTSGLTTDNHNYLTERNVGNIGCLEKGKSRPRFIPAGQEEDHYYNVGGTETFVSAYDDKGGKAGLPCVMTFTAHRSSYLRRVRP